MAATVQCILMLALLSQRADASAQYVDPNFDFLRNVFRGRPQLGLPFCIYDEQVHKFYVSPLKMNISQYTDSVSNRSILEVFVGLQLLQVEVDEKNQRITVGLSIMKWWRDCRLMWTPDVSPASALYLSNSDFTTKMSFYSPGLKILEDVDPYIPDKFISQVIVAREGWVSVLSQTKTTVPCRMSVADYPFDTQQCNLTFEPLADYSQINLTALYGEASDFDGNILDKLDVAHFLLGRGRFIGSETWLTAILPAKKQTRKLCDLPELFCYGSNLHYRILMRRHPDYQVTSLMVPSLLVVFISSVVFILPFDKSDKMGLSLSILISMFMFTQLMYDMMPDTGSVQPLLSQYFLACIGLVSSSCVFAALSSLIGSLRGNVPAWLQSGAKFYASYLLCDRTSSSTSASKKCAEKRVEEQASTVVAQDCENTVKNDPNKSTNVDKSEPIRDNERVVEWSTVSAVADRCFFVVHMIANLSLFIGVFCGGSQRWTIFGDRQLNNDDWFYICAQARIQDDPYASAICRGTASAASAKSASFGNYSTIFD